jgi:hypothetical protein
VLVLQCLAELEFIFVYWEKKMIMAGLIQLSDKKFIILINSFLLPFKPRRLTMTVALLHSLAGNNSLWFIIILKCVVLDMM